MKHYQALTLSRANSGRRQSEERYVERLVRRMQQLACNFARTLSNIVGGALRKPVGANPLGVVVLKVMLSQSAVPQIWLLTTTSPSHTSNSALGTLALMPTIKSPCPLTDGVFFTA
jgi:hypothetical protein